MALGLARTRRPSVMMRRFVLSLHFPFPLRRGGGGRRRHANGYSAPPTRNSKPPSGCVGTDDERLWVSMLLFKGDNVIFVNLFWY